MDKIPMVGCDLHDRSMLLKMAVGLEAPTKRSWSNDRSGRVAMIVDLKRRAAAVGANRIVFAYEASGLGFTLCDELTASGIECHVLAPTLMERSPKHTKGKTDERDAERVLHSLRAWWLAGNPLPEVWIPDLQTRDDREVVRMRLEVADKLTRCKNQIRCLLKRNNVDSSPMKPWTGDYDVWLDHQAKAVLPYGASQALLSLLRQLEHLESEREVLSGELVKLSQSERYSQQAKALMEQLGGVGIVTAMVFLTEIGDVKRFTSRQQVGSYLGLTPSSFESGETDDGKGHITRQGPGRVRKVLNQAVWSRLRTTPEARARYDRIATRNSKHKKKAVDALAA